MNATRPGRAGLLKLLASVTFVWGIATSAHAEYILISGLYVGGGNADSLYANDYVELFNRWDTAINLDGFSLQIQATDMGSLGAPLPLSGSIAAGHSYLIKLAGGSNAGGAPGLPPVDLDAPAQGYNFGLSSAQGRVAVVSSLTAIGCSSPPCLFAKEDVIDDLVGYGQSMLPYRGVALLQLGNSTAAFRKLDGCQDTFDNTLDFSIAAPNPRNSNSAAVSCGFGPAPPSPVVPLPAGVWLLLSGLGAVGARLRRQRR